jgi:2-C-methyl-D-erythritol 4-phosphate cytidylyltransferase/2-C-methyl-D-erythritol 2,4-cyclodiphosphate synthase
MDFHAIIVAAGKGNRMGGLKQFMPLLGKPVLVWSLAAFIEAGAKSIRVVVSDFDQALCHIPKEMHHNISLIIGGDNRKLSVENALRDLRLYEDDNACPVLIHDGARPGISVMSIRRCLDAVGNDQGAIMALRLSDTIKQSEINGKLTTLNRETLWRAQTPQGFPLGPLLDAFDAWPKDQIPTDDAQIFSEAGFLVACVEGSHLLEKLTYKEDFETLSESLREKYEMRSSQTSLRIGHGLDVHAFGPGDIITLCGLKIAHNGGLIGHSDADVALHALTDALLGAMALGDIGDHFPPSDPMWKGAASDQFVIHALNLMKEKGGQLINIDLTIIGETPKIKPHRQAMREKLSAITGLDIDRISLKATTTEKLGFTGRSEGLMAQATILLTL